jgi:hypothetical protein
MAKVDLGCVKSKLQPWSDEAKNLGETEALLPDKEACVGERVVVLQPHNDSGLTRRALGLKSAEGQARVVGALRTP